MKGVGSIFIIVAVGFALFWFWFTCLQNLMNRRDDEFPGRYDKILWVVLLLSLNVVGAVLYMIRDRVGKEAEREAKRAAERARAQSRATPPETARWVECPQCKNSIPAASEKCPCCGYQYFPEET